MTRPPRSNRGITIRDAAMLIGVPETNIRTWLTRVTGLRAHDGRICPRNLVAWYDNERDHSKAKRGTVHATKRNPYTIPAGQ